MFTPLVFNCEENFNKPPMLISAKYTYKWAEHDMSIDKETRDHTDQGYILNKSFRAKP